MRFAPTDEQAGFAASLDKLLAGADVPAAARAWATGDSGPGLDLWRRLADQGVTVLLLDESAGGAGAQPIDMVVAHEQLGRYAVPGPWIESTVHLPVLLRGDERLEQLTEDAIWTLAAPPQVPLALDADVADRTFLLADDLLSEATLGELHRSLDPTRRLFAVTPTSEGTPLDTAAHAFDLAALACAAQLLGAGERLLEDSVAYVKQRRQFGRAIGSYQAIKHRLADVRIALDFARPLVQAAALTGAARDVSAAKVAAGDAAYLSSRAALQVHGAIGYTRELDLSLWLTRVRAQVGAWGTPAWHRRRILDELVS